MADKATTESIGNPYLLELQSAQLSLPGFITREQFIGSTTVKTLDEATGMPESLCRWYGLAGTDRVNVRELLIRQPELLAEIIDHNLSALRNDSKLDEPLTIKADEHPNTTAARDMITTQSGLTQGLINAVNKTDTDPLVIASLALFPADSPEDQACRTQFYAMVMSSLWKHLSDEGKATINAEINHPEEPMTIEEAMNVVASEIYPILATPASEDDKEGDTPLLQLIATDAEAISADRQRVIRASKVQTRLQSWVNSGSGRYRVHTLPPQKALQAIATFSDQPAADDETLGEVEGTADELLDIATGTDLVAEPAKLIKHTVGERQIAEDTAVEVLAAEDVILNQKINKEGNVTIRLNNTNGVRQVLNIQVTGQASTELAVTGVSMLTLNQDGALSGLSIAVGGLEASTTFMHNSEDIDDSTQTETTKYSVGNTNVRQFKLGAHAEIIELKSDVALKAGTITVQQGDTYIDYIINGVSQGVASVKQTDNQKWQCYDIHNQLMEGASVEIVIVKEAITNTVDLIDKDPIGIVKKVLSHDGREFNGVEEWKKELSAIENDPRKIREYEELIFAGLLLPVPYAYIEDVDDETAVAINQASIPKNIDNLSAQFYEQFFEALCSGADIYHFNASSYNDKQYAAVSNMVKNGLSELNDDARLRLAQKLIQMSDTGIFDYINKGIVQRLENETIGGIIVEELSDQIAAEMQRLIEDDQTNGFVYVKHLFSVNQPGSHLLWTKYAEMMHARPSDEKDKLLKYIKENKYFVDSINQYQVYSVFNHPFFQTVKRDNNVPALPDLSSLEKLPGYSQKVEDDFYLGCIDQLNTADENAKYLFVKAMETHFSIEFDMYSYSADKRLGDAESYIKQRKADFDFEIQEKALVANMLPSPEITVEVEAMPLIDLHLTAIESDVAQREGKEKVLAAFGGQEIFDSWLDQYIQKSGFPKASARLKKSFSAYIFALDPTQNGRKALEQVMVDRLQIEKKHATKDAYSVQVEVSTRYSGPQNIIGNVSDILVGLDGVKTNTVTSDVLNDLKTNANAETRVNLAARLGENLTALSTALGLGLSEDEIKIIEKQFIIQTGGFLGRSNAGYDKLIGEFDYELQNKLKNLATRIDNSQFELMIAQNKHNLRYTDQAEYELNEIDPIGIIGDNLVPINVTLNPQNHMTIITGKNSGGKTTLLSTASGTIGAGLLGIAPPSGEMVIPETASGLPVCMINTGKGPKSMMMNSFSAINNIIKLGASNEIVPFVFYDEVAVGVDGVVRGATEAGMAELARQANMSMVITSHHAAHATQMLKALPAQPVVAWLAQTSDRVTIEGYLPSMAIEASRKEIAGSKEGSPIHQIIENAARLANGKQLHVIEKVVPDNRVKFQSGQEVRDSLTYTDFGLGGVPDYALTYLDDESLTQIRTYVDKWFERREAAGATKEYGISPEAASEIKKLGEVFLGKFGLKVDLFNNILRDEFVHMLDQSEVIYLEENDKLYREISALKQVAKSRINQDDDLQKLRANTLGNAFAEHIRHKDQLSRGLKWSGLQDNAKNLSNAISIMQEQYMEEYSAYKWIIEVSEAENIDKVIEIVDAITHKDQRELADKFLGDMLKTVTMQYIPSIPEYVGRASIINMINTVNDPNNLKKYRVARVSEGSDISIQGVIGASLLSYDNLYKSKVPVNISVSGGKQVVVLTGPNGGGKTTLAMNMLAMLELNRFAPTVFVDLSQPQGAEQFLPAPDQVSGTSYIGQEESTATKSTFMTGLGSIANGLYKWQQAGYPPGVWFMLDEAYSGTNSPEAAYLTAATVDFIVKMGGKVVLTSNDTTVLRTLNKNIGSDLVQPMAIAEDRSVILGEYALADTMKRARELELLPPEFINLVEQMLNNYEAALNLNIAPEEENIN